MSQHAHELARLILDMRSRRMRNHIHDLLEVLSTTIVAGVLSAFGATELISPSPSAVEADPSSPLRVEAFSSSPPMWRLPVGRTGPRVRWRIRATNRSACRHRPATAQP